VSFETNGKGIGAILTWNRFQFFRN